MDFKIRIPLLFFCPFQKSVQPGFVSGKEEYIALPEGIGRTDISQNLCMVFNGNDIDTELLTQIGLQHCFSDQTFGNQHFGNIDFFTQLDIVQYFRGFQTVSQAYGNIPFGIDDLCTHLL